MTAIISSRLKLGVALAIILTKRRAWRSIEYFRRLHEWQKVKDIIARSSHD